MNNNTEFYGYTVTCHMRPKWSLGHDLRLPGYVDNQKYHIDPEGYHRNFINLGNTEQEIYENVFGESIRNYNKRQKRKDRRIENYLQKIMDDGRKGQHKNVKANPDRKPFYQQLFYIGNQELHCSNKLFEKVIVLYITKVLPKKFPNFISCNANLHGDEFSISKTNEKTPSAWHVHNLGIYVAHALTPEELKEEMKYREELKSAKKKELAEKGIPWDEEKWKKRDWRKSMVERWGKSLERGPELQCSLSGACAEMGYFTSRGKGTAQQQVEEAMREDFMSFCESMGITIDRRKKKHREHLGREDYIEAEEAEKLKRELEEEKQILQMAKLSLENELDDFAYQQEHIEEDKKNAEEMKNKAIENYLIAKKKEDTVDKKIEDLEKREREIKQRSNDLSEKEDDLSDREVDLKNKEKNLADKHNELLSRERDIKQQEEKLEKEILMYNEDKKNLQIAQEKFMDEVFLVRKENNNHKKIIREWEEAAFVIDNGIENKSTDEWIDSEATKLRQGEFKFQNFIDKIKTGVKGLITKVKKLYEKKINYYEQKLNGYDYNDPKTGQKVHSFGCSEMQKMFCTDSSPAILRQIAKDMEDTGVSNYDELYSRKPKILERHFEYAREINRTNEITR